MKTKKTVKMTYSHYIMSINYSYVLDALIKQRKVVVVDTPDVGKINLAYYPKIDLSNVKWDLDNFDPVPDTAPGQIESTDNDDIADIPVERAHGCNDSHFVGWIDVVLNGHKTRVVAWSDGGYSNVVKSLIAQVSIAKTLSNTLGMSTGDYWHQYCNPLERQMCAGYLSGSN
jgi:desulfoferrodoxin (superoxide reductase-like protein)